MSDRASECRWQYRFIVIDLLMLIASSVGVRHDVLEHIRKRVNIMRIELGRGMKSVQTD